MTYDRDLVLSSVCVYSVFPTPFVEETIFFPLLVPSILMKMLINCMCGSLILDSLFGSVGLCVYFYASIMKVFLKASLEVYSVFLVGENSWFSYVDFVFSNHIEFFISNCLSALFELFMSSWIVAVLFLLQSLVCPTTSRLNRNTC